jgi:hypothetical protein
MGPFRAFTLKFSGLTNRIVTEVKLTVAYDPRNPPIPVPPLVPTSALWDTGATGSGVTPSVAAKLGLTPTGTVVVNHAGGASPKNTYLVNLYLPNGVAVAGVQVTECAEAQHFGVLIGMDIITRGDFSITNYGGQSWVSFRIPSMHGVDYVGEAEKIRYAGVGRNSPCPCGKKDPNGKAIKFKKCHGISR